MSNDKMSMSEIIDELHNIDTLFSRYRSIESSLSDLSYKMEEETDQVRHEHVKLLMEFENKQREKTIAKKPASSRALRLAPPMPPKKPETFERDNFKPNKLIIGSVITGLAFWASVAVCILAIIPMLGTGAESPLMMYSGVAAICFGLLWGRNKDDIDELMKWRNEQKEYDKKQQVWKADFAKKATDADNARLLGEFQAYDASFLKFVEICSKEFADQYTARHVAGLQRIADKYEKKEEELRSQAAEVRAELDSVTLIHKNLFENAWRIAAILETGRADTLKEAINLALDEARKDEEEEARREEARQQEEILERQAEESRRHNEAMQRAAEREAADRRAHDRDMERAAQAQARAAEAQAREAAKQTEMAREQSSAASRAASARCTNCANFSKCPPNARKNSGSCGAYRQM